MFTKIFKFYIDIILIVSLFGTIIFNTIYNSKAILILFISCGIILLLNLIKKIQTRPKINTIIGFYLLFSVLSYIFTTTKNLGLYEIALEWCLWLTFIVLIHYKKTENNLLYSGISLVTVIQSIFSIFQIFYRTESRAAGTFFNWYNKSEYYPNALGLFLLMGIPFIHNIRNNLLFFACLTTANLALFLSFSRGALLVYIIQNIIFLIIYLKAKQIKKLLTLISAIIISFIIFIGINQLQTNTQSLKSPESSITTKYTFSNSEKITSINERMQFFKGSLTLLLQKPLLGYGPDSFLYIYPQVQPLFLANSSHAHNIFLKIGQERGVISLFFFVMILLFTLIKLIENRKNIHNNQYIYIPTIAITGALLHNQIDFNLNFASNYYLFILALSLLILALPKTETKHKTKYYLALIIFFLLPIINGYWLLQEYKLNNAKNFYHSSPILSQQFLTNLNYKNSNSILADLSADPMPILLNQAKLNPYDAFNYNLIGELEPTQLKKQLYFKKAISANPRNHWIFYLNYYKNSNHQTVIADTNKILELLIEYLELAKQNIHYTAQQSNIDHAKELALLFYKITNNISFQQIYTDLDTAQKRFRQS